MKIVILFIGLILVAGCIRTDHLLLTDQPVHPVSETHPIQFFADPPTRAYLKIAVVQAGPGGGRPSWEELREALIVEARVVGADGIMELRMGGEMSGGVYGGGTANFPIVGGVSSRKVLTGTAIKFK